MKNKLEIHVGRILLLIEYFLQIIVALMLLGATMGVVVIIGKDIFKFNYISVFSLINNALLLLIVKEVLWTVIKFFRKEEFSVSSFLFIGVISGIRQILFAEVQKTAEKIDLTHLSIEIGLNAFLIFILIVSYYILVKADNIKNQKKIV